MSTQLVALCFDASAPARLARFWGGLLRWDPVEDPNGAIALLPDDDTFCVPPPQA
jgi:hypothetical protein